MIQRQPEKILLLGAGESGKSTFVKQMKILHKDEFTNQELTFYRRDLINNVLEYTKMLIEGMDTLEIEYEVRQRYFVTDLFDRISFCRKTSTSTDMLLRFSTTSTMRPVTPSVSPSPSSFRIFGMTRE